MSDADLIAAFIEKNGVTRIESGKRTKTGRELYLAVRGLEEPKVLMEDARNIKQRIEMVTDHAGREFYRNAEGEWL